MAEEPRFSERALQIIADNKIRAAIEAGEFEKLPGLGKPCSLIDEPYDPNWWSCEAEAGRFEREKSEQCLSKSLNTVIL